MRFVLAILAFAAAAVMVGFGIAQRTVFLEPDKVALGTVVENQAEYIVLEPEALAAHDGKQTITVSGPETVFLSYGRTDDVLAWIGEEPYVAVGYDAEAEEFTNELVLEAPVDDTSPTAAPATPEPEAEEEGDEDAEPVVPASGSDLWLDEFTGDRTVTTTVDVPEGISVLLASAEGQEAPGRISISWPLDNSTPWAGPLIAGGALLFLVGAILVAWGVIGHRRSRGPRRNLPKGPKGKLMRAPRPSKASRGLPSGSGGLRSRGQARRIALVPVLLVPALALTACSADYWPDLEAAPETTAPASTPATATDAADAPADGEEADEPTVTPAVTVPQMERIMRRVAVFTTEVDEARDTARLAERFTGPALAAREANYAIRGSLADHPALPAIPASPLTLTLPQQATGWPRTVLTIAQNSDDETVAPTALVLRQESPRENYEVLYATALVPDADVPEVAPASIGAPPINPEFKGLVMPTGQVAAAYADVLAKDAESEFAEYFDPEGDVIRQQLGVEGQAARAADLPDTADISFATAVGDSPTVALATNDSGALVAVSLTQTEQVKPNDGGTIGFQEGSPGGALSGFSEKSAKGVQRQIGIQLLFYVPAIGSDEQIRLLGWSESLIDASEVP